MSIIGISGKIGSGKDTVGQIIQILNYQKNAKTTDGYKDSSIEWILGDWDVHGTYIQEHQRWKIKKFADKLKDIVCMLIGCNREQLEDREFKEKELGEEWWVYKCQRFHNSKPYLISYLSDDINFSPKNVEEELIKLTPRLILQLLGTEAGRQIIHPNIWVNALFSDYQNNMQVIKSKAGVNGITKEDKHKWIITDTRFPNEAQAIKDRGGILIRVERDFTLRTGRMIEDDRDKHPSETSLDNWNKWDVIIDNNEGIEELITKVEQLKLTE